MPKPAFPITIRSGSVAVKIYRQTRAAERGRGARTFYSVSWHVAGIRRLKQFADLEAAKAEAKLKAEALSAGRSEAAVGLAMDDVALISELRRVAGKTPPLAALEEWARAKALCGDNLIVAAKAWADSKRATKAVSVKEAVEAFMTAKKRAGVTTHSYGAFLPHLATDMGAASLATVSASALEDWLHERYGNEETEVAHPGTFNTGRKRLVALWRWSRKQGYLPEVAMTEAEKLDLMPADAQRIGILSVDDFARILHLLKESHPKYLAVAVLAGFAGMRRTELHSQAWADVHLDRGLLRVTAAKRNTVSYRLVHLCPAAVEWLKLCPRAEGEDGKLVSPAWGIDRVRTLAREKDIETPGNAFRHSFISYRCAATGDVAGTAQEAGNSAAVVFKHYRELVAKADGEAWFDLTPKAVAKVVEGFSK